MCEMIQCYSLPECARALYSFLSLEIGYTDMAATEDVTKPVAIFRGATIDSWYHVKSVLHFKPSQAKWEKKKSSPDQEAHEVAAANPCACFSMYAAQESAL